MRKATLSRKLVVTNLAIVVGLLVLGAASLWGLLGLRASVTDAVDEYEEVRLVQSMIVHTTIARTLAGVDALDPGAVAGELDAARSELDRFVAFQATENEPSVEHQSAESSLARDVGSGLDAALAALETAGHPDAGDPAALVERLDRVLRALGRLERATDVAGERAAASRRASTTIAAVAVLTVLLIAGAVTVSLVGYRSVMRPLRVFQRGVRRIATGQFGERLEPEGDLEIVELADDFNRMAAELDSLYRVMEEKVAEKSRELVRSERLASVGFLAAGVAHEINTPLHIISGYAELSQKWLQGTPDAKSLDEMRAAVETIRQETFRCKGIIEQLLSLARLGDETRRPVSLATVAGEVSTLVRGLKKFAGRRIIVDGATVGDVTVDGNAAELKQVVLNLAVNALEATDPRAGEVSIGTRRRNGRVELTVSDNGRGIPPADLGHVFEPFFTRRGGNDRGLGLGLSISHAIIESHGGRLTAESDGPGAGSRFTITLPVTRGETRHDG